MALILTGGSIRHTSPQTLPDTGASPRERFVWKVELVDCGHMGLEALVSADRGPIVYIVEDDEAVRDALAILLESTGYAVGAFASARAFLDGYRPGQPGCLLVDLDLPGMDGPELVGILVARRIELPAVLMSGRMRGLRTQDHLPPGVVGLLEKPFGDHALLQRIAFALGLAPPAQ